MTGYNWLSSNLNPFYSSWEDEVSAAKALGYSLAPPDENVPIWEGRKLYTSRRDGMDEWRGPRGRTVGEYGYPLYYRNEGEDIAVGDLVNYRSKRGCLCSGCGAYDKAVVVSLDPFVLISEEGDMMWRATVKIGDFETVGKASREALLNVTKRLINEVR
jgi:hypothetical protein